MCPYDTRLKTNMDPEKRLVCKGKHVFVSAFFFQGAILRVHVSFRECTFCLMIESCQCC